jgi:guanine deaminase
VKVGLGTDIAGGYSIDIMNAMRQAVSVSRMREGTRVILQTSANTQDTSAVEGKEPKQSLAIDWKEALYIATRGGALALNDKHYTGAFMVGTSFDAQSSKFEASSLQCLLVY